MDYHQVNRSGWILVSQLLSLPATQLLSIPASDSQLFRILDSQLHNAISAFQLSSSHLPSLSTPQFLSCIDPHPTSDSQFFSLPAPQLLNILAADAPLLSVPDSQLHNNVSTFLILKFSSCSLLSFSTPHSFSVSRLPSFSEYQFLEVLRLSQIYSQNRLKQSQNYFKTIASEPTK